MGLSCSFFQCGICWQRWCACSYNSLVSNENLGMSFDGFWTLTLTCLVNGSTDCMPTFSSVNFNWPVVSRAMFASILSAFLTNYGCLISLNDKYFRSSPSFFLNDTSPLLIESCNCLYWSCSSNWAIILSGITFGTCKANNRSLTVRSSKSQ